MPPDSTTSSEQAPTEMSTAEVDAQFLGYFCNTLLAEEHPHCTWRECMPQRQATQLLSDATASVVPDIEECDVGLALLADVSRSESPSALSSSSSWVLECARTRWSEFVADSDSDADSDYDVAASGFGSDTSSADDIDSDDSESRLIS